MATATIIGRGMDARRIGRFKAVSVSRTKVPLAADGTHGMAVPPCYTIQGGDCEPYKGPVYGPGRWGYYR